MATSTPFKVSITTDGTNQGFPIEGLAGVKLFTFTFVGTLDDHPVTVSNLFIRLCFGPGRSFV